MVLLQITLTLGYIFPDFIRVIFSPLPYLTLLYLNFPLLKCKVNSRKVPNVSQKS